MGWPFPLSSYSCSKITNNTGINSIVHGIKAATKSVYYSFWAYHYPGTGLQFRAWKQRRWLLNFVAREGFVPLRMFHWSLLSWYLILLSVLSYLATTIRRLVFLVFFYQSSFVLYLRLCVFYWFSAKYWRFLFFFKSCFK